MLSAESLSSVKMTENANPPSSKPFSISITSNSKASSPGGKTSYINPKKRPHSSLADDADPDDEASSHRSELVSGFDQSVGGAIGLNGVKKEKAPLVIKAQKNRDWREESRRKRGKNLLPAEVQAAGKGEVPAGRDVVNGDFPTFGLTFVKKEENGDSEMQDAEDHAKVTTLPQSEIKVKTEDEEAMEALMGERKKSGLVIARNNNIDGPYLGRSKGSAITEDDAFRTDVASRPDSASLEDYAAIPVSEFGAALLRGMGWKGEQEFTTKTNDYLRAKKMERRPALLGIGAKEVPGGVGNVELGAWGKGGKGKKKPNKTYNPVLLKNAKTGEMLTEDELKAKQETHAREEEEWRRRRDRNLAIDEEKKSDRKHRDRNQERESDRSNEGSRHSSSRHDRSRSPGNKSYRHRIYDDNDSYDRSDKEKQRRERDGSEDDRRSMTSRSKHSIYCDDERESSWSSRDRGRGRDEYDSRQSRRRLRIKK